MLSIKNAIHYLQTGPNSGNAVWALQRFVQSPHGHWSVSDWIETPAWFLGPDMAPSARSFVDTRCHLATTRREGGPSRRLQVGPSYPRCRYHGMIQGSLRIHLWCSEVHRKLPGHLWSGSPFGSHRRHRAQPGCGSGCGCRLWPPEPQGNQIYPGIPVSSYVGCPVLWET